MNLSLHNPIIVYLISVNTLSFILFWLDKWNARVSGWRIPEMVLWLSSLIGGTIGAWCAMIMFHHKTKKLSFQLVMVLILLVQLGGIAYLGKLNGIL